MKKTFISLFIMSLGIIGISSATAAYYYGNTSTTYTYSGYVDYNSRASYTINCITYYYNPRTGASLGQERVCNNTYVPPVVYYPAQTYDYTYTHPSYTYTYPTNYYTYEYDNGAWYPGNQYGSGYGNNFGNNYGCYYQNGYQVCY